MDVDNGMTKEGRQAVAEGLEHLLVDTYALYLKTQNFHWNVRGSYFYPHHLLFETHYKEMAEAIDEIAERIGALGFLVPASFGFFKSKSGIPEEEGSLSSQQMVQSLVQGHEHISQEARVFVGVAEKEKDAATVDLLSRRLLAHEKMAWFLRSHL